MTDGNAGAKKRPATPFIAPGKGVTMGVAGV